jgi:histidine triad (HIT) family protein
VTGGGGGGSCVFCKIAAGEIPATIIKRGDGMLAFKDLNSQAPTHALVIPTIHIGSLNDAKDSTMLGKLLLFAREVAQDAGIGTKGYRVVVNTNPDGGQTVFHLHLHVLGGRAMHWPPG